MLFSSNLFLFLFLPVVIVVYYLIQRRFRNSWLLICSLFFYAWGEPDFLKIMLLSILFNYLMAIAIHLVKRSLFRKLFLCVTVVGNLSILFKYKYYSFISSNLNLLGLNLPVFHIALPLGISFFTFQAMSYVLDVYRGTAKIQYKLQDVALYVSFFPQLVAGPIVRYQTIADQIMERRETLDDFSEGVRRFLIGFSKKIILSNNMALVADEAFSTADPERSVLFAWLGAIAYAFQILFDFSGYSDMAIGLGKMFGFHFLENFDYPYTSKSVSEFWRRWHISLGQWFRDYVYFPLGGSRVSSKARLVFNLFVVWSLTGIWHGASWNFVIWGLFYFVLLAFEKLSGISQRITRRWQVELYRVFTLLCILVGWVFFRAPDLSSSVGFCRSMLGLSSNQLFDDQVIQTVVQYGWFYLGALICSTPIVKILNERIRACGSLYKTVLDYLSVPFYLFLLLWSVSYIILGSHNPFIYFNF